MVRAPYRCAWQSRAPGFLPSLKDLPLNRKLTGRSHVRSIKLLDSKVWKSSGRFIPF
ncbi:MAG: hypothetical protein ACTSQU_19150 [Promethearchaeota archaeon]